MALLHIILLIVHMHVVAGSGYIHSKSIFHETHNIAPIIYEALRFFSKLINKIKKFILLSLGENNLTFALIRVYQTAHECCSFSLTHQTLLPTDRCTRLAVVHTLACVHP